MESRSEAATEAQRGQLVNRHVLWSSVHNSTVRLAGSIKDGTRGSFWIWGRENTPS
jgi:hypothetical protein